MFLKFCVFIFVAPFIWSIALFQIRSELFKRLWTEGNTHKAKLIGIVLLQIIVSIGLISYPVLKIFSLTFGVIVVLSLVILFLIIASRTVRKRAFALSNLLDKNLSAREKIQEENRTVSRGFTDSLMNYDIHISDFKLDINSTFCGRSLQSIGVRKVSGVSVLRIVRNGMNINIPGGDVILYPGDVIVVAGSDEQIIKFSKILDDSIDNDNVRERTHVNLERFRIKKESKLNGLTIIKSNIREECDCFVMAIERDGEVIMNPTPNTMLHEDDILVLAGESEKIREFEEMN